MTRPSPSPFEIAASFVLKKGEDPSNAPYTRHLLETVAWLERLTPSPEEALRTAAVLHDVERLLKNPDPARFRKGWESFKDPRYLRWHQQRSAQIAASLLRRGKVEESFVERVYKLVRHHEEGGTDEQNLLKDADSLSFLDVSAGRFIEDWVPVTGKVKVREKIEWMFDRMTLPEAKRFGRPLFARAVDKLEGFRVSLPDF